jgi:hypothetical protein
VIELARAENEITRREDGPIQRPNGIETPSIASPAFQNDCSQPRKCGSPVCGESLFLRKTDIRLAQAKKLQYADCVVGGVFPPHPLFVAPVAVQIQAMEGWRMTRKSTLASLVMAVALSLTLTACKDTKTLQENEQLKAQVADLQKQNGEMGNNLETVTAARDALTQENETLRAEIKAMKPKTSRKKPSARKHRRS